jgi:hypothetical protein
MSKVIGKYPPPKYRESRQNIFKELGIMPTKTCSIPLEAANKAGTTPLLLPWQEDIRKKS